MKKALTVVVLLGMFSVCTSAFGTYILEYNLNILMKGVDINDNNDAVSMPLKGFLVMDFNEPNNELLDANLIIYGKDPNNEKNLRKVFVQLNMSDANEFLDVTVTHQGDYVVFNLSGEAPFGFETLLIGREKSLDIGASSDEDVARTLKGVIWQFNGILLSNRENIEATGNVQAALLLGPTKLLNLGGLTLDDAISVLQTTKLSRHTEVEVEVPSP